MNSPSLILIEPPELSGESASEMLNYLYLIVEAFENQYSNQLRQYYQSMEVPEPPEPDLFDDFDELPPF